ncbi:anaerobic ribonucleoside-triphosphate reductase activating protein [Thiovibrio frasassiensis]|uniref:Anaerobic ribonucleoside-triphosphate reductase activating protein n=1 Tax=Thiovibrio frasassiensis TaxID=2984131 RepID=A0A9X4RLB2_9BACT|nr:anaerobic ribonucleoside-triphosphate reductase activating protein [Thiovibrio frasassiensis]MDG4475325.1 anaerobic ribonucleoside-triphosphate reductase activating protein [Thiovibrio frasassiensis]
METSFIDWPGKLCAILFVGGCNFRCPFCHNHPLVLAPEGMETIAFEEIMSRLAARKNWLAGVCISGGEPTLSPGLPRLIARLKAEGWAIKLDTNGTRPEVVAQLLGDNLLDMVAMDVKTVLVQDKYERCAGSAVDLGAIQHSIDLLCHSGIPHEFRMTIAPALHSEDDIVAWAKQFDRSRSRLKLQNFNPRTTLDVAFEKEQGFGPEIFSRFEAMVA